MGGSMKLFELVTLIIMVCICASVIGLASTYFCKDDAPIEEVCEEVIKAQSGLDIDLTPNSKES